MFFLFLLYFEKVWRKGRIREALIKMILDFDIPLETEE